MTSHDQAMTRCKAAVCASLIGREGTRTVVGGLAELTDTCLVIGPMAHAQTHNMLDLWATGPESPEKGQRAYETWKNELAQAGIIDGDTLSEVAVAYLERMIGEAKEAASLEIDEGAHSFEIEAADLRDARIVAIGPDEGEAVRLTNPIQLEDSPGGLRTAAATLVRELVQREEDMSPGGRQAIAAVLRSLGTIPAGDPILDTPEIRETFAWAFERTKPATLEELAEACPG